MPFTLIKGSFVPEAGRPDGDSVRFRPEDPCLLCELKQRGRPPRVNRENGTIQLRYEGIDSVEKSAIEPFASNATQRNLELLGGPTGESPGFILSNQVGPNGRPIAFVYTGTPEESDGTSVFLDPVRLRTSVNFQLISEGHAYPLFYDTLFAELRQTIASEVLVVRDSGRGIWSEDGTVAGVIWSDRDALSTLPPIFPKLWRRLQAYTRAEEFSESSDSLERFIEYMQSIREERVFLIDDMRATGFDDLISVENETVRLLTQPELMVIVSIS